MVTKSQVRAYIFLIKGQNVLLDSQQCGKTNFFYGFSLFHQLFWFPYSYYIFPNFRGAKYLFMESSSPRKYTLLKLLRDDFIFAEIPLSPLQSFLQKIQPEKFSLV